MKRSVALILSLILLVSTAAVLSGCGSAADGINNVFMINNGVIVAAKDKAYIKVFDRYDKLICTSLSKVNDDDYPQLEGRFDKSDKLYLLDFQELFETSDSSSFKCRYYAEEDGPYLEHTYIFNSAEAEGPEVYSAVATAENGVATLTVETDAEYARLFKVWTGDIPEDSRFDSNALPCISGYDLISDGILKYSLPLSENDQITFCTRGIYNAYGYEGDDILMVNNTDYPNFITSCVSLDVLNVNDERVYNLGNDTHMSKYTIYKPSESTNLVTVVGKGVISIPPVEFTATLTAERGKAVINIPAYPNAVYYRAVITEICNGEERTVLNKTLAGKNVAEVAIRTDSPATYRGNVYAVLSDGTTTEKLQLEGFTTKFTDVVKPNVTYENGEVKIVFPRNITVTVWRSGADVSTDTLVIGSRNTFAYMPETSGDYGFIYKAHGNDAEILDSPLIESAKVHVSK